MNSPILRLAHSTTAVEEGVFAAGLTVIGIAFVQSFVVVLSWFVAAVI